MIPQIPVPLEDEEQATLLSWCSMNLWRWPELDLLFHIPNGGARRKSEAARFKSLGVKKGVPDLFLPVPRGKYHGLFIEMKRLRGGRVSNDQKKWIAALKAQGYRVEVDKGWKAAADVIREYLGPGRSDPA